MNYSLLDIEERIKDFLFKETNKGKAFSLLFIAKMIDPRKKVGFKDIEVVLRKMEIEGTLYHNEDVDTWELFPYELGFVQCSLFKNKIGEGLINMPDGRKYKLEDNEAGFLLDGDIITIKPTDKRSGNRMIATLDKIVKRKNGLVVVEVTKDGDDVIINPIGVHLGYPISLDQRVLDNLEDHSTLLVRIDELNSSGILDAEYVKKVDLNVTSQPHLVSKKEIEDYSLDTYMSNVDRMHAELDLEDYTVTGVLNINKFNEGMIEANGKRYCVRSNNLGDALNGDTVEIIPSKLKSHGSIVSVVNRVIKRQTGLISIEVTCSKKGKVELVPINYPLKHKIVLPEDFDKPLVAGDRLIVKIGTELEDGKYVGQFVRSFGHKDDPDADIKLIAAENEIEEVFSDEEMAEAYSLPTSVSEEEKVGRLDYTKKKVFTIDGVNTKDRDDAMSIEELDNGNYLVGVHNVDLTHYIHPGMILWLTILHRGTSVYMDDTVIPMLPHILSNGICSLNPGVDRLTLSCMMELTPDGEVVNYSFEDVVIKSRMAMTYDDVNEILEHDRIPDGYEDFVDELKTLHMLSQKLSKKRSERGAINFDDIQSDDEVVRDENGKLVEFITRGQYSAEKLIENFMLLAGKCYADYMMVPTPYRVHEEPDADAVDDAIKQIKKLGVKVTGVHDVLNGYSLTKIIQSIKDQDIRVAAANIILRSMKRARMDVDAELGHFALAESKQGQITSPVRRAGDAIAHLQIRKQRDNLYNPNSFVQEIDDDYFWIADETAHITRKQYNAEKAEKDAIHLRMSQYIEEHLGETFYAVVNYINEDGIYIKTSNGVLGKIDPHDYEGDFLIYDDKSMSFIGRKSGIRIKIGSRLNVIALDTHREYRTINFGVSHAEAKRLVLKKGA